MPQQEIYKPWLKNDANLRRWYNNIRHSSVVTADGALRRIGKVCSTFDTTPDKLSKLSTKAATNFLMDLVTELDEGGKQPTTIKHTVEILKSWFRHNQIQITQKIKIPKKADRPSKVSQEQSPTPDQVRRVLDAADLKQKSECALVGFAGLRLESVGDYLGEDGIKVKDLPEMSIDNVTHTVTFEQFPTKIVIRSNLSKAGHQYLTFMPEEGCQYIKELLEYRINNGEKLNPESPLVTSLKWHKDSLRKDSVKHITSRRVGTSIKAAIKIAGFNWRPYILRTYFDTRLLMAEGDGLIIRDYRSFFMGHRGDIEHVYTLNKGLLPEDLVEKMREAFAKSAEKCLITFRTSNVTLETVKAQFNRQLLELAGYSDEGIDELGDLGSLTSSEINELLQENSKRALGLNGNNQKVILLSEVEKYVTDGWEYLRDLPPNKAIIRLPKVDG